MTWVNTDVVKPKCVIHPNRCSYVEKFSEQEKGDGEWHFFPTDEEAMEFARSKYKEKDIRIHSRCKEKTTRG